MKICPRCHTYAPRYAWRKNKKKMPNFDIFTLLAEREGFEPPVPRSTTVFKTAAIDHSAISPGTKV